MESITDKYKTLLSGVLSCYDRIVITGTLPVLSNARMLTTYMFENQIRIFDYAKFAEPFRDIIKSNADQLAKASGVEIEYIRRGNIRKEALIEEKIKQRGDHPGLVHILSVMEKCTTYKPWHDKPSGKNYLKYDESKCVTYYFYFIDEDLGLCFVRVPTWLPFKLQIFFNGHGWLEKELDKRGVKNKKLDNAFIEIADWSKAQQISDGFSIDKLHNKLDTFAKRYCPVHEHFKQVYHWSILQCEYATDIVFKRQKDLAPIYEELIACAMHTVKPKNVVTFLGKKLDPRYEGEVGNRYQIRIQGSRIKHTMGKASIKMYDKFSQILRVETTTNDVSFFKHYREVRHRDASCSFKYAAVKKNIYSLAPLSEILRACNQRYIEFISSIDDHTIGHKKLEKATTDKVHNNRNYKGFNFFKQSDKELMLTIASGEFNIYGFRSKDLKERIGKTTSQISRILKRLRVHGLIKKAGKTYKYYLTTLGKEIISCSQKVINMVVIPQLSKTT